MTVLEVGFKIKEDKKEAEKLLLAQGFQELFKTTTRDIYFGKDVNFEGKDETQIKTSLIRCRNFEKFENLKIFDKDLPDKLDVDFKTMHAYFDKFFENGYEVIFDTQKTDWVYYKGKCWHQLQDIKDIGLLDYVLDKDIFDKSEDEQFEILMKQVKDFGLHLEYELGVDKLRSLYNKKLMFSKNQAGLYEYQK